MGEIVIVVDQSGLNFAKKLKSNEKILIDNVFDCKDLECIVHMSKQMIKQIIFRIDYIILLYYYYYIIYIIFGDVYYSILLSLV